MKYAKLLRLIEKKDHLINKIDSLTDEQKQEAIAFFTKHPNYESEIDWNRKDLTWDDFEKVIYKERISKSQLEKRIKAGTDSITEGVHYSELYRDNDIVVYQPFTYIASRVLASRYVKPSVEGKWCISYQKDRNYWDSHSIAQKEVFLFIFSNDEKYAVEIHVDRKNSVSVWLQDDTSTTVKNFLKYYVTMSEKLLETLIEKAISNYSLVVNSHKEDLEYTKKMDELRAEAFKRHIEDCKKSGKPLDCDIDINRHFIREHNLVENGKFTVTFGKIIGDFDCSYCDLTSLKGAPYEVEGSFYCDHNLLESLEGSPKIVNTADSDDYAVGYDCSHNFLKTLEGAPDTTINFDCSFNSLTTLKGSPNYVMGDFNCSNNKLSTLEGAPDTVDGNFIYKYNYVKDAIADEYFDRHFIGGDVFNGFQE